MNNNINNISRQVQKCGNMKYKTQSEIQVLCQQEGKALFFTDEHADTINTTPIHLCLKRLISAVSTQIRNFVV